MLLVLSALFALSFPALPASRREVGGCGLPGWHTGKQKGIHELAGVLQPVFGPSPKRLWNSSFGFQIVGLQSRFSFSRGCY